MATQESNGASLPHDVHVTTVEALLSQLQRDAENLVDLAQEASDSYSEGWSTSKMLDTVDCANLVAASGRALHEVWRREAREDEQASGDPRHPIEVARDALRAAFELEESPGMQSALKRIADELPKRPR